MYQLGHWVVDESANLLTRDGENVRVEKRVMAVLAELVAAKGEVVTKDALIEAVWNGAAVSDHSVANAISDLRRVLGDDRRNPHYIDTIPKRGYRLIADVSDVATAANDHSESKAGLGHGGIAAVLAVGAVLIAALFMWLTANRDEPPRLFLADIENATGDPQWTLAGDTGAEMLTVALAGGDYRLVRWRANDLESVEGVGDLDLGDKDRLLRGRIITDNAAQILSLQLVDLADGASIWANSYELGGEKFGALSNLIATDLKPSLGTAIPSGGFDGADAATLEGYWRARYLWSLREHGAIREALRILTSITEKTPGFAPAHAALADIYAHKSAEELAIDRSETYPIAERHLQRALAIDPEFADTYITTAYLKFFRDRDARSAKEEIEKALSLAPENAVAWQTRAMITNASGDIDESLNSIDKARTLDPLSASMLWDKVWFLYIGERYDEALAVAAKARTVSAPIAVYEALIHTARGDDEAALESWLARAAVRGLSSEKLETVKVIAREQGAVAALGALADHALDGGDYREHAIPLAALLMAVGETDAAIATLDDAPSREKSWWWSWYDVMPVFDDVREQQQLANLIRRKIDGSQ